VERVILALPGIEECAVLARRHPMLDEEPVAFVLPTGGAQSIDEGFAERIMAHCREQLADFKVPRAVWFVEDLPRSTLEKIAKAELRRRVDAGQDRAVTGSHAVRVAGRRPVDSWR